MGNTAALPQIVVIGKESVGKSQLVAALTGRRAVSDNFPGSTIACEFYADAFFTYIDTPGILRLSDSHASRLALDALTRSDRVLLVVSAAHLDQDLDDLLSLVENKHGAIVVTFWDKVDSIPNADERLTLIRRAAQIPVIAVDARRLTEAERQTIHQALAAASLRFPAGPLSVRAGWRIEPKPGVFEIPVLGQAISLGLLILPAWFAAQNANALADRLFEPLKSLIRPLLERVNAWPGLPAAVFGGDYGVVAMLPFLLLYSVPTVLIFAVIIALLKASGLVDRMTTALHPLMLPFGLAGRDLVRVMMGFGCNVPAVINTRSCSICTRENCVTAIGIGAACSYQLPATVAVLAAAGNPQLITPFLVLLVVVTMALLSLSASRASRDPRNPLMIEGRAFLQWPPFSAVTRETLLVIRQFFVLALPVFFIICAAAAVLAWSGVLEALTRGLGPAMAVFNLPQEAAAAVVLGSIRKDGLAIALLDMEAKSLKVGLEGPVQLLTAVLLAGVFLPCLVTVLAIARELGWRFALRLMLRQAAAAAAFCALVAWVVPPVIGCFFGW